MLIGQVVNFLQQRFFGVALGQLNLAFLRLNVSHDPVVFFRRYVARNFLACQVKALIQCFGQSIPFGFFFVQLAKLDLFFFSLNAINGALVAVTQGGTDDVFFTKQIKGLGVNAFWFDVLQICQLLFKVSNFSYGGYIGRLVAATCRHFLHGCKAGLCFTQLLAKVVGFLACFGCFFFSGWLDV